MTNLNPEICLKCKEARKQRGLSQSALAEAVGCKQSAVSAFENGDATKLSEELVKRLAKLLEVSLEVPPARKADGGERVVLSPPNMGMVVRGFCPDANCPSNIPYMVGDRLVFHPVLTKASPGGGGRCACCGEVLEMRCPACGAPLNDGACCGVCGSAYVTATLPPGLDAAEWARSRRAELSALKGLC